MMSFTFDPKKHEYRLNGRQLPSVTDVLRELGFIDPQWFTEESRQRGVAVHAACQYLDEGDLLWDEKVKAIEGYVRAWQKFKEDTKLEILDIERPLYHPIFLFGGRPDRRVRMGDFEWILDIKTGVAPKWGGLQTGAYDLLYPMGQVPRKRGVVELRTDGSYNLVPHEYFYDGQTFLSIMCTYSARRNYGILTNGNI